MRPGLCDLGTELGRCCQDSHLLLLVHTLYFYPNEVEKNAIFSSKRLSSKERRRWAQVGVSLAW